jgi:uncharacterized protein (DUF58 family)
MTEQFFSQTIDLAAAYGPIALAFLGAWLVAWLLVGLVAAVLLLASRASQVERSLSDDHRRLTRIERQLALVADKADDLLPQ